MAKPKPKLGARKGGTPPKDHQFKPGQSGNSRGRPRKDETMRSIGLRVLGEDVEITLGGHRRTVPNGEALWRVALQEARQGNYRMLRLFIDLDKPEPQTASDAQDQAEQDAKAFDAVLSAYGPPLAASAPVSATGATAPDAVLVD